MQPYAIFDAEGKPAGFYFEAVHGRREIDDQPNPDCTIPATAIAISEEDYQAYIQEPDKWLRDPASGIRVTAPPPPPPTAEQVVASLAAAIQAHLDAKARERNYDGILSACTYATSGNAKFKAEGEACLAWRDNVWSTCYQIMAEIQAGSRTIPTAEELIAELPVLAWPGE